MTRTREPEIVPWNLYVLKVCIVDSYLGTWTRTWELEPVLGNLEKKGENHLNCRCLRNNSNL
jgi:hypothetical protein